MEMALTKAAENCIHLHASLKNRSMMRVAALGVSQR